MIARPGTGYILDFIVYEGRNTGAGNNGLGYEVVWILSEKYRRKNHHLYFDNYFASVKLIEGKFCTISCAAVVVAALGTDQ